MKTVSFEAIIMSVVLLIIVLAVVTIAFSLFRKRVKAVNQKLPDLNKLEEKEKVKKVHDTPNFDNRDQLKEAMSVTPKTKINREDYIKGDKKTTLEQDFGDIFEDPSKKLEKEIEKNTKPVVLPKLNHADDKSDTKEESK